MTKTNSATSYSDFVKAARAALAAWDNPLIVIEDSNGYEIRGPLGRAGWVLGRLRAAVEATDTSDAPWAIMQGGLVQDSSPDVEYVDLDWLDSGLDEDSIDEMEQSWSLLIRVILTAGRSGWMTTFIEVTTRLDAGYERDDTPAMERVWNKFEAEAVSATFSHPDAPRVLQANYVAYIVTDVAAEKMPDLVVTLDFQFGIADMLWKAGFRRTDEEATS